MMLPRSWAWAADCLRMVGEIPEQRPGRLVGKIRVGAAYGAVGQADAGTAGADYRG